MGKHQNLPQLKIETVRGKTYLFQFPRFRVLHLRVDEQDTDTQAGGFLKKIYIISLKNPTDFDHI